MLLEVKAHWKGHCYSCCFDDNSNDYSHNEPSELDDDKCKCALFEKDVAHGVQELLLNYF